MPKIALALSSQKKWL